METWVFQQDGASIHKSTFTRSWLTERDVRTIDWPAKSSALNIIEKMVHDGPPRLRTPDS